MMNLVFSIITVTYNASLWLERILSQSQLRIEYIITDATGHNREMRLTL
jgi:hypothetical protein